MGNAGSSEPTLPPLQAVSTCNTEQYMGTWFVIGVKPTMFEKTNSNAVETYSRPKGKGHDIDIGFKYNKDEPIKSPLKQMTQKGWILGDNKEDSGLWKVSPLWPIKFPYLVLELDEDKYSYVVIGVPNRDYAWIMYRNPIMPENMYDMLQKRLVDKHQYNLDGFRKVPQVWTADERARRGFTQTEIPDSMLSKPSDV